MEHASRRGQKVKHMAAEQRSRENVDDVWQYCSVCRRNHDEGRKHIFTKQHKNRLSVVLSKFTKKVNLYIGGLL